MADTITQDIHSTYADVHIPREEPRGNYLFILSLAALGVVYGDIGTSPLYALRECFHGAHAIAPTPANILGVLSLIFWSLIIVISIKYLVFVVRADNEGEGGILSLAALATPIKPSGKTEKWFLIALGIFGAALLYGDGVLTPAISILGAMEGLSVATPALSPYVVPDNDRDHRRFVFYTESRNCRNRQTFRTRNARLVSGFGNSRTRSDFSFSAGGIGGQSDSGNRIFSSATAGTDLLFSARFFWLLPAAKHSMPIWDISAKSRFGWRGLRSLCPLCC